MAKIRIGFSSDFVLENSEVGIGTTNPTAKLHVAGVAKADFNITGVSTLRSYGGFIAQKQNITKASAIGFGTVGLQTVGVSTGYSYYETETGYTSLVGEYNTLSDDLIVDDGKIFEIKTTSITGVTTIGTQSYDYDTSRVSLGTLESVSIQSHFTLPNGGIETRPENPIEGTVRFNDDLNTLEFYNGIEWRQFTVTGASGRGVFGGGRVPGNISTIDYINIMSQGNAQNFGDLLVARTDACAFSNEIRGIWAAGKDPAVSTHIDYVTLASRGNGVDFGDVTPAAAGGSGAACSSSTRGVFALGQNPAIGPDLHYVQIMTTGASADFGDLTGNLNEGTGFGSSVRGIFTKGSGDADNIDMITIASLGNAIEFGQDCDHGNFDNSKNRGCGGCSNSVRGIFAGGGDGGDFGSAPHQTNAIRFVTISSTGNAIRFGELQGEARLIGAVATSTRGIFSGGINDPAGTSPFNINRIDYVTIASTGNALDFGDLTVAAHAHNGCSDSHGGLGGF